MVIQAGCKAQHERTALKALYCCIYLLGGYKLTRQCGTRMGWMIVNIPVVNLKSYCKRLDFEIMYVHSGEIADIIV